MGIDVHTITDGLDVSTLRPTQDHVLIRLIEKTMSSGGIHIASREGSLATTCMIGQIISLGRGIYDEKLGSYRPWDIKVGDWVLGMHYVGERLESIDKPKYRMVRSHGLWAKVTLKDETTMEVAKLEPRMQCVLVEPQDETKWGSIFLANEINESSNRRGKVVGVGPGRGGRGRITVTRRQSRSASRLRSCARQAPRSRSMESGCASWSRRISGASWRAWNERRGKAVDDARDAATRGRSSPTAMLRRRSWATYRRCGIESSCPTGESSRMIDATEALEKFLDKSAEPFVESIERLVVSLVDGKGYDRAISELAERLKRTLTVANLNGRRLVWREVEQATVDAHFGLTETLTSTMAFLEARRPRKREPRLAPSAAMSSNSTRLRGVRDGREREAWWSRKKVQDVIARSVEEGTPSREAEQVIADMGPWTRSYAENVYQTNVSNAYAEGRIEQAKDPAVKEATPAFLFVAMDDQRVRPNHWAANGFIAATDDPIWKQMRPPLGYR